MDIVEIRSSFVGTHDISRRVADWRNSRVGLLMADEGPAVMHTGGMMVVHLVPLESMNDEWRFTTEELAKVIDNFSPPGESGSRSRVNVDGITRLSWSIDAPAKADGYCHVFRSGRIEACDGLFVLPDDQRRIPSVLYEQNLVKAVNNYLNGLQLLGVSMPILLMVTLVGVKGAVLACSPRFRQPSPIDRDVVLLPDILVEDFGENTYQLLRPIFDAIWNASGFHKSENFDEDGNWRPHR